MYGSTPSMAAGAGSTAMLAVTGFSVFWLILAATTLVFAGIALWNMIPRKES